MPGKIFINYRRGDEPGFALALYGRLEQSFATEQLFMDVEGGIHAGDDFVKVLETQVAHCDVLLALIGQGWVAITDENGARRLDNPDDFVRIEIESAMRLGKRVIPVLLNKAEMPRATDLPEPLKPLSRRNAVRLTQERFRADVQGLIKAIETALREDEAARAAAGEAKLKQRQDEASTADEAARAEKERTRLEAIAGLSPEQIAKAEELANWEFIKASTNAQDFRDHLARFPSGMTGRFAQAQLEELAWAGLGSSTATVEQLGDFIAEFPHGAHAKAAADRRTALENEKAAALEANEQQCRETEAWAAASAAGNVAAFAAFLKEWPQGQHAAAARARTKELKGAPTRRWLLLGAGGAVGSVAAAAGVGWTLEPGTPPWRLINDRSIRSITGTGYEAAAFSRDGRTALSVVAERGDVVLDYKIKLWEMTTGKEVRTFAERTA